ncbi:MAG: hypothetical protein ABWK01_07625 [Infirmifilum sp.]
MLNATNKLIAIKAVNKTMLSKVDGEGNVLVDAVELPLVGDVLNMDCEGANTCS